jgi:hypothetical protein
MSSVDKAFRARERRQKALGSNDFFFFCDNDDMLEPSITMAAFAGLDFDDDDGFFLSLLFDAVGSISCDIRSRAQTNVGGK